MLKQIIEKAYAKINLGLEITGKRDDGYHLLKMVMQTVSLYDRIGIYQTNEDDEISMDMDFGGSHPEADVTCDDNNLCVKAARLILSRLPVSHGYYIHLVKNIPVAAGMAGGSTDAAAVLRGINAIEGDIFTRDELREMALTLGADVPFCIDGGLAVCEGIGEVLTPIDHDFKALILLGKTPEGVSTPAAYKWSDEHPDTEHGDIGAVIENIRKDDIEKLSDNIHNDLENAAKHFCPDISSIEQTMLRNGALLSRVTGSGPTVFGIFRSDSDRKQAAAALRESGLCADIFSVETVTPDYRAESSQM